MRKRLGILTAGLALALTWTTSASAAVISFDPDGAGPLGPVLIDSLDPSQGNGISLGLNASSLPGEQSVFLYQANLSAGKLGDGNVFSGGVGGASNFTFVAAVQEQLLTVSGQTFTFGLGSGVNLFQIYADDPGDTGVGDSLSGQNFAGVGTTTVGKILVAQGTFMNNGTFAGSFTVNDPTQVQFDQFGANDYSGVTTATGTGSFQGQIDLTFLNPAYFTSSDALTLFFKANGSLVTPFTTVNPSACFYFYNDPDTGECAGGVGTLGVGSVGTQNGLNGTNTMLLTDANLAFDQAVSEVPEPATLTLMGIGLLGSAAMRRRQLRKRNNG